MANKKQKTDILDIKYIYFFSGILICLISIILIINVGYVARALAFVPFFLFGIASCTLYFATYLIGLYTLLKDKVFRFTTKLLLPGFFVAFVGLLIVSSAHVAPFDNQNFILTFGQGDGINTVNFSSRYIDIISNINDGGYFEVPFLHYFNNSYFGGGYLGFLLVALINDYAKGMNDLIGGGLIAIGSIMVIGPYIFRLIKKHLAKSKDKKGSGGEKETTITKPQEKEIVKPVAITTKPIEEIKPVEMPAPIEITTHSLYEDDFPISGSFSPAHFSFATRSSEIGSMNPMGIGISTPVYKESESYKPKEEVVEISGEQALKEEMEKEIRVEQMTLDFDAPLELSEEERRIATAKPIFQEPVVVEPSQTVSTPEVKQNTVETKPLKPRVKYINPDISLLNDYEVSDAIALNTATAEFRANIINSTFEQFKVGAEVSGFTIGPAVTRFHVTYKPGVLVKSINNILGNLCVNLGGIDVRFEPMVAGECYSGLEVANAVITTVGFKEVYEQLVENAKTTLHIPFGKNISGQSLFGNINEFPHMLIAGTTGSGKSVFVQTVIMSLIMRNSPDDLKLVLIDPKQVELSQYSDIAHLLCPIITEISYCKALFEKLCIEMDERYAKIRAWNLKDHITYNKKALEKGVETMPTIVVVIDEFADLVKQVKEIVPHIERLSAKARACGIVLIVCTQRPSTDVVNGTIKTNLPTHVALKVANSADSVVILNEGGAEKLLGKGDMLVQSSVFAGQGLVRIQSPFAKDDEIERVCEYIRQNYKVDYNPFFMDLVDHSKEQYKNSILSETYGFKFDEDDESIDPDEYLYQTIKEWAMTLDFVSGQKMRDQFSLGHPKSARMFKRLIADGIVEDNKNPTSSKGCRVLVHDHGYGETYIDNPALDETQYEEEDL